MSLPLPMDDAGLLALHREAVAVSSVSGDEDALATRFLELFRGAGVEVRRHEDDIVAVLGSGPTLLFNTHLDTVPPAPGWTLPPWEPTVRDGRVYGLGSNDAKASVAAMTAAFLRIAAGPPLDARLVLTLVAGEETGGKGTEFLVDRLREDGLWPDAVVVGEPTGLNVAVAQKGLLILELVAKGQACHAANRRALRLANPVNELARDLVALEALYLGAEDPDLGPVTVEPTVLSGGTARNVVPAEASCVLDVRVNPVPEPQEILKRLRAAVSGEIRVLNDRLGPVDVPTWNPVVRAALAARPEARTFGSRGLSDWVFFEGVPGIKVGPGRTERSHTADEYVLESEVLDGARFYEALARQWAGMMREGAR